jgi:uncharacterized protein (UPF0276 family)
VAWGPLRGSGIGLRGAHLAAILANPPELGWLELVTDNYLGLPEADLEALDRLRARYPVVLHGVGLSIGSTDPLNQTYLAGVRRLADRLDAALVSEHLAWVSVDGVYVHDLLPLPLTRETVEHVRARIERVQEVLGRRIAIENPSRYLGFREDERLLEEVLSELTERTGCGLLLDLTNVQVSTTNLGGDARSFVDGLPLDRVAYVHLAGPEDRGDHLLDNHSRPVPESAWELYRYAVQAAGPLPALIEWDRELPGLDALVAEAHRADALVREVIG